MDSVWLQSWPRFSLRAAAPAFQLNGEVSTPDDRVIIVLAPERTTAGSRKLGIPTCGFTTRGITVSEQDSGQLSLAGVYAERARTSYVKLPGRSDDSEKILDRCEQPLMIPASF